MGSLRDHHPRSTSFVRVPAIRPAMRRPPAFLLTLTSVALLLAAFIVTNHFPLSRSLHSVSLQPTRAVPQPLRQGQEHQHEQHQPYAPPPTDRPLSCHTIGYDPAVNSTWLRNSRAFCLTPAFCVRRNTDTALGGLYLSSALFPPSAPASGFASGTPAATCSVLHPDLSTAALPASHGALHCPTLCRDRVLCVHGRYLRQFPAAQCGTVRPLSRLSAADNSSAQWLAPDRVAVVVPAFPLVGNIYHFSFIAVHVPRIVSDLRALFRRWEDISSPSPRRLDAGNRHFPSGLPRRVTVIFRGTPPLKLGKWQASVTSVLLRRLAAAAGFADVAVTALFENSDKTNRSDESVANHSPLTCAHAGVILGARGKLIIWLYENSSAISSSGHSVPAQAVANRRAIYDEYGVSELSSGSASEAQPVPLAASIPLVPPLRKLGEPFPNRAKFAPPPLVLGYAERARPTDPPASEVLEDGWRRFSDADDQWFKGMLRAEAARAGMAVKSLLVTGKMPVREQVRLFASAGVVVGIHGANLVNTMFSPPFASLVEITPGGHDPIAYFAGGNAGLAYWKHTAELATREESFCGREQECWLRKQQRRVKVESAAQREKLRATVREAIEWVLRLRRTFPHGIPTTLQLPEQRYGIDWP